MSTNYIITSTGTFLSESELYHHGIKGQKWGVRRYQNVDGSLTAAGRKKYVTYEDSTKNSHEKLKKAAKVGAVVAGTALAVYGGYKLSQYTKNKKSSAKLVNDMLQKPLSMSKVASATESGKNAVKAMASNATKSVDVPKVTVPKVTIPKTTVPTTTVPKTTVSRATVNSAASSTVKNGASAVKSTMSSYGSYDWDSLRKANTNLLNQTLDDLLKGL